MIALPTGNLIVVGKGQEESLLSQEKQACLDDLCVKSFSGNGRGV